MGGHLYFQKRWAEERATADYIARQKKIIGSVSSEPKIPSLNFKSSLSQSDGISFGCGHSVIAKDSNGKCLSCKS